MLIEGDGDTFRLGLLLLSAEIADGGEEARCAGIFLSLIEFTMDIKYYLVSK